MENCLFCKIIRGEIPVKKIFEDDHAVAFHDINPQAPHHILIIPREHYCTLHEVPENRGDILVHLFCAVSKVVIREGLMEKGYRLVINAGKNSGQEVPHIHIHLLAGRRMGWPPG